MSLEALRRLGHNDSCQLLQTKDALLSYTLEDLPRGQTFTPGIRVRAAIIEGMAIEADEADRNWPGVEDPHEVLTNLTVKYVVYA